MAAKKYYSLQELEERGAGIYKPGGTLGRHHMVILPNPDGTCTVEGSNKGRVTIKDGDTLGYCLGEVWRIKKPITHFEIFRQMMMIPIRFVESFSVENLRKEHISEISPSGEEKFIHFSEITQPVVRRDYDSYNHLGWRRVEEEFIIIKSHKKMAFEALEKWGEIQYNKWETIRNFYKEMIKNFWDDSPLPENSKFEEYGIIIPTSNGGEFSVVMMRSYKDFLLDWNFNSIPSGMKIPKDIKEMSNVTSCSSSYGGSNYGHISPYIPHIKDNNPFLKGWGKEKFSKFLMS